MSRVAVLCVLLAVGCFNAIEGRRLHDWWKDGTRTSVFAKSGAFGSGSFGASIPKAFAKSTDDKSIAKAGTLGITKGKAFSKGAADATAKGDGGYADASTYHLGYSGKDGATIAATEAGAVATDDVAAAGSSVLGAAEDGKVIVGADSKAASDVGTASTYSGGSVDGEDLKFFGV